VNLIPSTAQRRRWFEIVISGLIIPTYLLQFHVHFLQWDVANPKTTTPFPNNLFLFSSFARFSQSELLPTISDGTVASS